MASTPTPAAESVPGYVHDVATGQWYQIGVGAHTHAEDVKKTGDTMTGQLGLPAPTLGTNAARYADGLPRFADAAARDAFYAALPGGVQEGMRCYLLSTQGQYVFIGNWRPAIDHAILYLAMAPGNYAPGVSGLTYGNSVALPNGHWVPSNGTDTVVALLPGTYLWTATIQVSNFTSYATVGFEQKDNTTGASTFSTVYGNTARQAPDRCLAHMLIGVPAGGLRVRCVLEAGASVTVDSGLVTACMVGM